MKIIQVVPYYYPYLGGMQIVAKEIAGRLSKKGNQVEVFTSDVDCPKDKQLKSTKNLKIHYLKAKEFAHTPIIPSLYKELMKIPQDSIMHVHVAQAYVPEVVYKIWKKRKIPYVAHIHCDPNPSSLLGKLILKPYKYIFLKKFLKNSKMVLVLTENYREIIFKKYKIEKKKIRVIPNGIGEDFFIKEKYKKELVHLLFVGRISIDKNLPRLIGSVDLCKSKFILDIVGDGELLEKVKKLVKQKSLKNVIFHGRKIGKDLINIYKSSDILILPSKKESFGLVLLEAMATRTAIIASNILGIRNVIKNNYNGLLIKPTTKEISQAIEKLIKNPKLRERLAKNGLKEVKKYSWDNIIEQTEKVYKEILKEHNQK